MFSQKTGNLLLLGLFFVLGVVIPLVVMPLKDGGDADFTNLPRIVFTLLQVPVFVFYIYYVYPRFLIRKRVSAYLTTVVLTCVLVTLITTGVGFLSGVYSLTDGVGDAGSWIPSTITKFFTALVIAGTATCYAFLLDMLTGQRLEKEQLRTELAFLRSQVSPHFMFNTLNSLVSLARKRSDKLEPALIKLSNLMQYMLYESEEEKVRLSREVDYLQSYIDLQTMRFGNRVQIRFTAEKPENDHYIEPMLLIPLVENAFKHGIGMIKDPEIDIQVKIHGRRVSLEVRNKYNAALTEQKDKVSGIGLANLSRRLNLLYPGRHVLSVRQNGSWHTALLKIQLHDQMLGSG